MRSYTVSKVALDEKYRTKILAFSKFPIDVEDYEEYFARMRSIGFDVRTNQTNRTVPLEHFRICYPFTLPSDWKIKRNGNDVFGGIVWILIR